MPTYKQQRPLAYYHHYKYHNYLPQISLRLAFPISQITISNNFYLVKTTAPKETHRKFKTLSNDLLCIYNIGQHDKT